MPKRSTKDRDGLCEVLAPGYSDLKNDSHTSVIEEPGNCKDTVRRSDIAKIGTEAEWHTHLKEYADRTTKRRTGKTTEKLIAELARDARKQLVRRLSTAPLRTIQTVFHRSILTYHEACESKCRSCNRNYVFPRCKFHPYNLHPQKQSKSKRSQHKDKKGRLQPTLTNQEKDCTSPSITESDKSMNSTQTLFPPNLS